MKPFMTSSSYLYEGNAPFLEALRDDYLNKGLPIPAEWKHYFDQLSKSSQNTQPHIGSIKQFAVYRLIEAYRLYGVFQASLDPLNLNIPPPHPLLQLFHYGLNEQDLSLSFDCGDFGSQKEQSLSSLLKQLQRIYSKNQGIEYNSINNIEEKKWLQERIEGEDFSKPYSQNQKKDILKGLIAAEGFEKEFGQHYIGAKRFSLEGCESLIPALKHLINHVSASHINDVIIGMAHRGRLNVLVNILGMTYENLCCRYDDELHQPQFCGDVPYHQGCSSHILTPTGSVHLSLAYNPSHLEIINPVVLGSTRARQEAKKQYKPCLSLPVMIHGDAALSCLGVNYSTLNISQLPNYSAGGTLHIVLNNQIGFTTARKEDLRSSYFCTDIAKIIEAPVFHVRSDEPETLCRFILLALDYRNQFGKDVFIDLVGFRKNGHNETDNPFFTQPRMYMAIQKHQGLRTLYSNHLKYLGLISDDEIKTYQEKYLEDLKQGNTVLCPSSRSPYSDLSESWELYKDVPIKDSLIETSLTREKIQELGSILTQPPKNFSLHPLLEKLLETRRYMASGDQPIDWGMAENIAYSSLLQQKTSVRVSGEDVQRGTFSHRHAVFHNQSDEGEETWCPLQTLCDDNTYFTISNSPLNEEAILAFEYGYASSSPEVLVLWEAQFGDFANSAQVVIDQFISASETKWGYLNGLVLNLPHGSDGSGPEHSSARLERWLQLCAKENMNIVIPSRSAQMFHILRQQVLCPWRKPLIIFMSKRLLRTKQSMSDIMEFTSSYFREVIGDATLTKPEAVTKVVFCSGQIYYDLLSARTEKKLQDAIALIRIERLYPFPEEALRAEFLKYPSISELVWVQEEPENQGAWHHIRFDLERLLKGKQKLSSVCRPASPSPAVSSYSVHKAQLQMILDQALIPPAP